MTVLEVIQRSSEFLIRKGVDSPRLQVELLLAHVLQTPRMKLYLNFERALSDEELNRLRELVKRRGEREPLQHILGSTSFCGLEMAVSRNALIPRPETELLAERAIAFLSALPAQAPTLLDFGTGSGCLAVAIAARCPGATLHALDISESALKLARENADRHRVSDRIQFHLGDGFTALPAQAQFDLIVSNPPYIPSAEIETLQAEVRNHDPRLALDGGPDGLGFYRRLATESGHWLQPSGRLMVELGDGQATAAHGLFTTAGWTVEGVEKDYGGSDRILIARHGQQ